MNTLHNRKDRERHLLERFLSVAEIAGTISGERESPDFEVTVDGRCVGVEITEVFLQTPLDQVPLQAQESLTQRIVVAAKQHYERERSTHIHVSVTFCSGMDIRHVNRDAVARSLANLVMQQPLRESQHTSWHNDYENEELEDIAFVNVLPVPSKDMAHWSIGRAGWAAPLTIDLLASRVSEKNRNVDVYRKRYGEVWLVIAVEGSKPSQFFNLDDLPDTTAIRSEFDETYFFSSFPGRVLRIGAP